MIFKFFFQSWENVQQMQASQVNTTNEGQDQDRE